MAACNHPLRGHKPKRCAAIRSSAVAIALFLLVVGDSSAQQAPPALLAPGNAAVTGFSGALPPAQIAPAVDPVEKTFIDFDGPSLRIVDLQRMGGPPKAQIVSAIKPFTVKAAQIGQVFGVAVDNRTPPNIYVAASSAYGLPIVAPGPGGQLQHIKLGAPNARFMPGLWGGAAPNGGPGSIWKIDGATGAVSLFANVRLDGRSNSGPALGGIAFDPDSSSLFVADRETGFIHRISLSGTELGRYDHGVSGRNAQGLPPVTFDPARRLDVTTKQFDSTQPTTWNHAAPERRMFGLGVFQGRLYYAVLAGRQIWSVGLKPDRSFGDDATIEIVVPPAEGPTEIAKITFDEQGRMFLGERPAPTGADDLELLTPSGVGRVLRYALIDAGPGGPRAWQSLPDDYAIGFPGDQRNGNGGVAIGYRYDPRGELDRGSCGGFLWSTGEQLRKSSNPALAAKLSASGPPNADGLQGNDTWRIRHYDPLPLQSYFIDYDDRLDDDAARGYLGDIAILRACGLATGAGGLRLGERPGSGALPGGGAPPSTPPQPPPQPPGDNPPGTCPPGEVCGQTCTRPNIRIGGRCCAPDDLKPGGACSNSSCGPGQTSLGNYCCNSSLVYTNAGGQQACCLNGQISNGQCQQGPPPVPPNCSPGSTDPQCCANGYVSTGSVCCLASQLTPAGICCPSGQAPSGPNKMQCEPVFHIPTGPQCCAPSLVPAANGSCCAPNLMTTTGICCPAGSPPDPHDRSHCPAQIQSLTTCPRGYTKLPDGSCCNNRYLGPDGRSCRAPPTRTVVPPVDCSLRGPNFIRDPRDVRACIRCGGGRIASGDHTACVPRGGPPPPPSLDCSRRGSKFVRDPDNPRACVRCGDGRVANNDHTACIRIEPLLPPRVHGRPRVTPGLPPHPPPRRGAPPRFVPGGPFAPPGMRGPRGPFGPMRGGGGGPMTRE
jgi:hypothetical protein